MVSSNQVISDLTLYHKDDIPAGILYATSRLEELKGGIEANLLIFSDIEENKFRWSDEGRDSSDWFNIWTNVRQNLINLQEGRTSKPRGIFSRRFNRIAL